MIGYKKMVNKAREAGVTNESVMWRGIEDVDALLERMKEDNPEAYWAFMRKSHATMYGPHYDEDFAVWDVSQMHHTRKDGTQEAGEHWTKDEVVSATQDKVFPAGTTDWDKYVALNAMYHDLNRGFSDSDVIEAAWLFYFADEDAPDGKVWTYMCAMHG